MKNVIFTGIKIIQADDPHIVHELRQSAAPLSFDPAHMYSTIFFTTQALVRSQSIIRNILPGLCAGSKKSFFQQSTSTIINHVFGGGSQVLI